MDSYMCCCWMCKGIPLMYFNAAVMAIPWSTLSVIAAPLLLMSHLMAKCIRALSLRPHCSPSVPIDSYIHVRLCVKGERGNAM